MDYIKYDESKQSSKTDPAYSDSLPFNPQQRFSIFSRKYWKNSSKLEKCVNLEFFRKNYNNQEFNYKDNHTTNIKNVVLRFSKIIINKPKEWKNFFGTNGALRYTCGIGFKEKFRVRIISTFSVLRLIYFELFTSTRLLWPLCFDLLSNLDFLFVDKHRSKCNSGWSKVDGSNYNRLLRISENGRST